MAFLNSDSGKEVNMSSSIRFQGAGHWTSPEYKHFFRTPRGTFLTNQVTSYTLYIYFLGKKLKKSNQLIRIQEGHVTNQIALKSNNTS
jgi:hypothetical protein